MEKLLVTTITAALRAGDEIMKVYKSDFTVELKLDHSPLTQADKNAHRVIKETLAGTHIPILSEENREEEFVYALRKKWERLWIVDPLDGTKEFVKKNGEFTVNIALVEDQKPVLGVIYQPVTRVMYFAAKGMGSFRKQIMHIENSSPDAIIASAQRLPLRPLPRNYTVVASRSHINNETQRFIDDLRKTHPDLELINGGSSLKFCLVAEGSADIYPRFGPTMEWDTAAGQAIAELAGKQVIDHVTRKPITYNRANLLNNGFTVS
ncbi:MAG TPA: 3'(2'),5'-bisphosphate nucleotidase CysQ [Bacteroidia bacterium]|jgi:3'(2'), 5'-bisphosphate nucleotidase